MAAIRRVRRASEVVVSHRGLGLSCSCRGEPTTHENAMQALIGLLGLMYDEDLDAEAVFGH